MSEWSGFGSVGIVSGDSDIYGYRNDISQSDGVFKGDIRADIASIIGLQLDFRANEQLDFVAQAVYRDQENFDLDAAFSQAFARYSPSVNWSFRLGRMPIDFFHLTEYRDIGFAYQWTKVPNEVYGIIPYRNLNGFDTTFQTQVYNRTFRTKFFWGNSASEVSTINQVEKIKLKKAAGISLELESESWILKSNYNRVVLGNDISAVNDLLQGIALIGIVAPGAWPDGPAFAADFSLAQSEGIYASLSARYFSERWSLTSEISSIKGDSTLVRRLKSGFVTYSYNFNQYSIFASYALTEADSFNFTPPFNPALVIPDPVIAGAIQRTFFGIALTGNFFGSNQETMSLGSRWDIGDNIALKFQWDRTDIDERGGTLWLVEQLGFTPVETVNTFHLNLSFIF